jgi:hypothetical protein
MAKATIKNIKLSPVKIKDQKPGSSKITFKQSFSKAKSVVPFQVKFINVGIVGYGPNNPAPIGIAVVGKNNYIL